MATHGKNATTLVNGILDKIQNALDEQTLSRFIERFRIVASAATSSLATRSEETVAASAIALASSTLRLVVPLAICDQMSNSACPLYLIVYVYVSLFVCVRFQIFSHQKSKTKMFYSGMRSRL